MKPIFYFDDTCEFCRRCVRTWRNLVQGKVEFVPFEKNTEAISVVFVSSEGIEFKGARAVFEMFVNIPRRKWMLWIYLHFSFARIIFEYCYKKISSCRTCAEKIARIFSS